MVSRFKIVDKEYIKESKDKREKWKHKEYHRVVKEGFQKLGEWKKLAAACKFRRVGEQCPQQTIVAVLSIPKFSNFALYVINK